MFTTDGYTNRCFSGTKPNKHLSVGEDMDNGLIGDETIGDTVSVCKSPLGKYCSSPDILRDIPISPLLWPSELKFTTDDTNPVFGNDSISVNPTCVGIQQNQMESCDAIIKMSDIKSSLSKSIEKNEDKISLSTSELEQVSAKMKISNIPRCSRSHNRKSGLSSGISKKRNPEDVKAERAIRNRESAKRSRMRTKIYFDKLEKAYLQLQKENVILKRIVARQVLNCKENL